MIYIYLNKIRNGGIIMFLELLAKIGLSVAATPYTTYWFFDEPECPESLIK